MSSSKEKQRLMQESLKTVDPIFKNFIGVISPGVHENHKTVYAAVVCYTAVFSGEERCVTTLKTAV